jgi:hypothetical protein
MLTTTDILTRSLTREMMNVGVNIALKGLTFTSFNNIQDEIAFTEQRIIETTTYVAFRRCLYEMGVPHSSYISTPFTDPDRQNIVLGGRRCIIQAELTHKKEDIRFQRRYPETILDKEARFQDSSDNIWEEDLLLFAFVTGLLARSPSEIHKAYQAQQPLSLMHTLPLKKRALKRWSPLGTLALKTDARRTLNFELGGQRKDRTYCTEKISIPAGESVTIESNFFSLTYIKAQEPIFERLALKSKLFEHAYIAHPHQWHNIWVYGLELSLAGYMTWSEFRRKAAPMIERDGNKPINPKVKSMLCLPVDELYPLDPLLEKIGKRGKATGS